MGDARIDPFMDPDPARFPNTRRRTSLSAPDAPSSSRSVFGPDVSPYEPDTCRICRGEGSAEEPLFYPCKCSGSIKYVHQDCLMEWLSHSQKKHCELCKTPFRFTKLYAHDMPKALPAYVFISHMTKYIIKNLLVWLRAALVLSVWLVGLPYLMRYIWSFLFWISDEGFGGGMFGPHGAAPRGTVDISPPNTSGVCPSSPLFSSTAAVTTVAGLADQLAVHSRWLLNATSNSTIGSVDPLLSTIFRILFGTAATERTATAFYSRNGSLVERVASQRHPSLLSEVGFLCNLTRYPSLNRFVIAVCEGLIITVLVIVCFILIILVRDYVVQQQPEINMRAAFAAENLPPRPLQEEPQIDVLHHFPPAPPDNLLEREVGDEDEGEDQDEDQDEDAEEDRTQEENIPPLVEVDLNQPVDDGSPQYDFARELYSSTNGTAGPSAITPEAALGRFGGEEGANAALIELGGTTVHEYMQIYREAGGDPEKILKIVEDRQLEGRLDYWVKLTKSMMDRVHQTEWPSGPLPGTSSGQVAKRGSSDTTGSDGSEWIWADDQNSGSGSSSKEKGKSPARQDEMDSTVLFGSSSRPRANTDGPKVADTIHPLANNNWSFRDLPQESATTSGPLFEPFLSESSLGRQDTNSIAPFLPDSSTLDHEDQYGGGPSNEAHMSAQETTADPPAPRPPTPVIEVGVAPQAPEGPNMIPQRQTGNAHPVPRPPVGLVARVADFMWRDVDALDPAEIAVLEALDAFDNDDDDLGNGNQDDVLGDAGAGRDREVVEAAVAAGLDPDAIEDAEDLEGILELLGMRGPVVGLFQNAIFCTFLVSITIFVGIFVPYNIGRFSVWIIANPVRIARIVFSLSKFVQDCALVVVGFTSWLVSHSLRLPASLFNLHSANAQLLATITSSWSMAVSASNRITGSFMTEFPILSASEMRNFSAVSHQALLVVKEHIMLGLSALGQLILFLLGGDYSSKRSEAVAAVSNATSMAWAGLQHVPEVIVNPSSWVINFSLPETTTAISPDLAYWNGVDRFWAIMGGYIALSVTAGLYLRRGSPFSTGHTGQEWEASFMDALNQASGVMKVILIIGIEMLVFPLYCGMLLDIALLPLFESASLRSRLLFTVNYPVTSIFVHWFVGTGYMFHFALFVSMCRKIMRKGVLYFIRDPDDPEFHPVRDVLERNVTTQLRKILFSAFVYGALVMICLGGVVWGLALSLPTVLPIHYSSNEPVLEFPIDLLFYNFLMPLAVKFFKPAEGLHAMYTWWFRKCARSLRITWFLFGERRVDEEGHLVLKKDSPHAELPWWRRLLLELSEDNVVPKTWNDFFEGGTAKPVATIEAEEMAKMNTVKASLVDSGQLIPDGRFVRTPGSDQVKIPKGKRVFLEVTENNIRQDGKPDQPEADLYSTPQYQFVYVPPNFRARVSLFILLIWIFAAVTGVSITIVPLVFGRRLFQLLIPDNILTNDIYAFSIGLCVLGSAAYTLFHVRSMYGAVQTWVAATFGSARNGAALRRACSIALRVARVFYAYFFILLVFPLMVTSLMELYAMMPLREFMYGGTLRGDAQVAATASKHTVRLMESWTVGLLYMKLGARAITYFFRWTRLAAAVRAVLHRGWLDPDISVLTRAFVIPGLLLWLAAVSAPLVVARMMISHNLAGPMMQYFGANLTEGEAVGEVHAILIHRLSFPLMAASVLLCATLWSMIGVFRSWKVRIRDEAYLIGERLHNFGVVNGPPRLRGF
ncbi:putative E3 ubiquitin ligase SUD1 [Naviculisporaceae sp. PSN 640]